ncbi:MAG: 16S rRNA (uracil(1498)-N(3))-methyltransferase [Deltaproteobacteria bacterium]|nr:16S rRNA (uracil(1498)-N(3))-methyltransferase [Deltaproteobacteria bacterium]
MNLVLLFESDRIAGTNRFAVRDHRATHIREVLRGQVGQEIRVGLLKGPRGFGTLVEIPPPEADAAVRSPPPVVLECTFEPGLEAKPRIDLCLAIPRPRILRRIFAEVTAMGVDRLVLFRARRTEKAYLSARILEPEHHDPLLFEGLMQSKTTHPPEVRVAPAFKPFVEDLLPDLIRGAHGFIAHPEAHRPFRDIAVPADARVVLVVGPEGGFIPYEIERLEDQGLGRVSLGPRILRVETACVALLAALEARRSPSHPPATD